MSGSRRPAALPRGLDPGELKRKALHVSTVVVPLVYLAHAITRKQASLALAIMLLVLMGIEVARLRARIFRDLFQMLLGDSLRRHERRELLGGTYLVLGFLVAVLAFPRNVAVTACEYLVIGDTAAALVGKGFGRVRLFDKTLEGSVACLLACAAVGWGLVAWAHTMPLSVALAGALAATLFELLPVPLDDNLKIPLSSGLIMHFLLT